MRTLFRVAGGVFGLAATAYFLIFVHRIVTRYDLELLSAGPLAGAVAIAALSYALIVPTTGWAWCRLLRDAGVEVPILRLNMIIGTTQIAKYLPGNFGQHLGRSAMAIRYGIGPGPLLVTLAIEMILAIGAAASVGLLGLLMSPHGMPEVPKPRWEVLSLAALCLSLVVVAVPLVIWKLPWLIHRLSPRTTAVEGALVPRPPALVAAFAAYVLNYLLIGAALYCIALAVSGGAVSAASLPIFIGTFAASWLTGFVVPGAPAGLGVREGVMVALLTPTLDSAIALSVIVAFRVATTCGDVVGLLWGAFLGIAEAKKRRNYLARPDMRPDDHCED
ncbi:MAG TPA: YbhN family protein [Gemmatimonadales bacterium]|jgi:Predicted integral membrane protein